MMTYHASVYREADRNAFLTRLKRTERERDAALLRVRLLERQIDELMGLASAALDQRDEARARV